MPTPQAGRQRQVTAYTGVDLHAASRGSHRARRRGLETDDPAEHAFRADRPGDRRPVRVLVLRRQWHGDRWQHTDIDPTDYEELSLDDLVVRLVTEELAALTGDETQVPPPPSTSSTTTIPDGQ